MFNPASFFLCRDEGGTCACVVVEVHNTYGERHLYTLRRAIGDGRPVRVVDGQGVLRVAVHRAWTAATRSTSATTSDGLRIAIALNGRTGTPLLSTSLVLRRVAADRPQRCCGCCVRHPLMPHRTIALIHWHALRLWLRGVPFLHHGARQPRTEVAR